MMRPSLLISCALNIILPFHSTIRAEEQPLAQGWDYASAMREVAARGEGRPGVVLHIGDSITYANPYGQWARSGAGKTDEDRAVLRWMHAGADDDSDGWWLARFDHPDGGRSYTACGGLRADELLAGGKANLPPLREILDTYRPRAVVLMIGTNDASAGRDVAAYRADVEKAVGLILDRGAVCILSTIPPHPKQPERARTFNEALRSLARSHHLPLIDFEREILTRRPRDWNGTLLGRDDVHPNAEQGGTGPTSAPTAANLRNSGYLLRGWLTVRKVAEVKWTVFDRVKTQTAPRPAATPSRPPRGQEVRLPVRRDTWFSEVGREADANLGGAPRLKLKSIQEMTLVDIDPAPLRGRVIRSAALHLRRIDESILHRVTVSSFGAEWVEGTSPSYAPQPGSSSFRNRRHPDVPWTIPGSDLCSVILGQGGTLWRMADASAPDDQGWQTVPVDPRVLAARVAGISHGLFVFDDTGSEWTRRGETFTLHLFPNRFVHSRESGRDNGPFVTAILGGEDRQPPGAPGGLQVAADGLPPDEARVSWTTPGDRGEAGVIGFLVRADGQDLPRHLIPIAGREGERVRMHLRDLKLAPGATVRLEVRAVDGAGNVGAPLSGDIRVARGDVPRLPDLAAVPAPDPATPLPRLGNAEVAVLDELDKVQPVTGALIPPEPPGYLAANHLWDAGTRRVRLSAARNEFVGFQVLIRGAVAGLRPELTFEGEGPRGIEVAFGRYHLVPTRQGPLPDPIVPLDGPATLPEREGLTNASLYCEVYVPHQVRPGTHHGRLTLRAGAENLELPVELRVWDFTLPDVLSFLPDMNCYDLPAGERAYYRLAHRHRTVLSRVPYYHSGNVAEGLAPGWDGKRLDWAAWDRRFGPYFDGSAFADLPRQGVPLECFYLPLFENWPTPMEGNYNGDYWADRAFPPRYWNTFKEVSRQFAEHLNAKGWGETFFQFFLNGKNNFKARGWSRGTSPWLLDEPANFQDYWALRTFGAAFHEGIRTVSGPAKLVFRCDISRPQWQRDALDGLLDYNVVGGAMRSYHRIVFDRKDAQGQVVVEYGSANALEDSNVQPVGWSLDSWSLGTDGVLPWQTVGTDASWKQADTLALFYPGRGGSAEPVPSIRLKAFRRGQQDVEYLTYLALLRGVPRWAIGGWVRDRLHLAPTREGTGLGGGEDAGVIRFARLRPADAWALRVAVGQALSEMHPPPRRRLVELRTPRRDPRHLAPALVSDQ